MTTIKHFAKMSPLPIYFILAFAISWGAILLLVGPEGIPATPDLLVVLGMAMLLGPSVAAILMTGVASGRVGFRELVSRLLAWRMSARWYAVALLTAPIVNRGRTPRSWACIPPVHAKHIHFGRQDFPSLVGDRGGLFVGLFEELGWTGFAIPRMRLKYSVLTNGLIVGLLWGAWHFLLFWEDDSFYGAFPLACAPFLLASGLQSTHGMGLRPY